MGTDPANGLGSVFFNSLLSPRFPIPRFHLLSPRSRAWLLGFVKADTKRKPSSAVEAAVHRAGAAVLCRQSLCSPSQSPHPDSTVVASSAGFDMGISKTEVNLKRLLATAPRQQNQAKLVHYVATLRSLLEQLGAETTSEGVTSISKAKLNDYSKKIEALVVQLTAPLPGPVEAVDNKTSLEEEPAQKEQAAVTTGSTQGLRRRLIHQSEPAERTHDIKENGPLTPVRLDDAAQAHIERHRKLQEDLTDEMVVLAQQLKESSLVMNRSLQETEKVLDSTERAVEHSLASTGRANVRAMEVYSESAKTSCFTWLVIFMMTCVFIMVVLLIRVT